MIPGRNVWSRKEKAWIWVPGDQPDDVDYNDEPEWTEFDERMFNNDGPLYDEQSYLLYCNTPL